MRILLTGASSFTGLWFAQSLHAAGHQVVAPLRRARHDYRGDVRAERVARLGRVAECRFSCVFGDDRFLDLCRSGRWDLLCHHAAEVGDYRSPAFDVAAALAANTRNFPQVLTAMTGLRGVVATGSVFEANEGAGTLPLRAFSLYGVAKGLSADLIRAYCDSAGVSLGKFVIPNPFGPFEEPRFCAYLMRQWRAGAAAEVRTPAYVRDNIHVDLLAGAYAGFAETVATARGFTRINPSGYVETQGAFAQRFAREVADRTRLDCRLVLAEQTEFPEPPVRINTDPARPPAWSETAAWDAIVDYYAASSSA
ncbi:MAG TPA: NAD-dependent epimerase/dehydratase family protein [Stellaceae bacterium]|nr:NAD-dependent epimerase/dehydratase family protein [Stellaceae bacterium]